MTVTITPFDLLPDALVDRVAAGALDAASADGVAPLSEAFELALPRPGTHHVATDGDDLAGRDVRRGVEIEQPGLDMKKAGANPGLSILGQKSPYQRRTRSSGVR